jgi:hypothetical protein
VFLNTENISAFVGFSWKINICTVPQREFLHLEFNFKKISHKNWMVPSKVTALRQTSRLGMIIRNRLTEICFLSSVKRNRISNVKKVELLAVRIRRTLWRCFGQP